MQLTGKQLIGFSHSNTGVTTFTGFDPKTDAELSPAFYEATEAEVDLAVRKAQEAFQVYRQLSGVEKAAFLEKIAEEILNIGDDLIQTAMLETALPQARLQGERGRTVSQLRLFAQLLQEGSWVDARIDTAQPDRQPLPKSDLRHMQIPMGPVAVFGASNFPLAFSVAGGDTVSALAAGCTVVFKAHPAHPATCELVGAAIIRAVEACKLPEGVFSMVHGLSHTSGMALVTHPLIQAVGFTGSFRGGKALFDAAAKRPQPIPVYAEMGSTNPVFFLPQALQQRKEALATGLVGSFTLGVGQFCTNPGLFVTESSPEANAFVALVAENLSKTSGGCMLTAGIRKAYEHGIEHLSIHPDVNVLAESVPEANSTQTVAYLLQTNAQTVMEYPNLTEEVFGPSSMHIQATDKTQVLAFAQSLQGHLTATVHGTEEDLRQYVELLEILEQKVGRVVINGFPTGVEVTHAMVHGGPYPATTDARTTSVGTGAIRRFVRPVCYQDYPVFLLPPALQNENPLNIWRLVNGEWSKDAIA